MKRLTQLLAIFSLLVSTLLLFTPAYAKYDLNKATGINLKQTEEYLANWLNSEKFPESITIAYYYVYSLPALGKTISPHAKRQIIDFIKRCQSDDGGFSTTTGQNKTDITSTYYALKSLTLLDSLRAIDRERAASFILGLVTNDGGITSSKQTNKTPSLTATFYGVQSLEMLGEIDKLNTDKTASFVKEYLTASNSFSSNRSGKATPRATYMGVATLDSLDRLTDEIKTGTAFFLKKTSSLKLSKNGIGQSLSSLQEMTDILQTSDHLAVLEQTDKEKMYKFVESLYQHENGGFGYGPDLETTPASTYLGIVCLVELGKLHDPLLRRVTARRQLGRLFYHLMICEGQRPRFVF